MQVMSTSTEAGTEISAKSTWPPAVPAWPALSRSWARCRRRWFRRRPRRRSARMASTCSRLQRHGPWLETQHLQGHPRPRVRGTPAGAGLREAGAGRGAGQRSWRSWLAVEGPAGGEKGPPAGVQETLGWGGAREEGCVCRGRRARSITGLGKEGRPESTVPGAQPGSRWRRGVEEALLVTPSRPGHPASRSLGGQGH